jgi:hypothetical protein
MHREAIRRNNSQRPWRWSALDFRCWGGVFTIVILPIRRPRLFSYCCYSRGSWRSSRSPCLRMIISVISGMGSSRRQQVRHTRTHPRITSLIAAFQLRCKQHSTASIIPTYRRSTDRYCNCFLPSDFGLRQARCGLSKCCCFCRKRSYSFC